MASAFGQCRRSSATFLRLVVTSSSWRCSVWIRMFSWTASSSPISLFTIFWTSPMGKKMFPYPASMRLTRHPHPRWPTARSGSRARAFSLTQAPNFWSAATARTGAGTSELAGLPPVPPPLPRASTSLPFPPLRDLLPRLERLPLGFRGSERGAPGLTWPHGVTPRALRRVCRFLRFPSSSFASPRRAFGGILCVSVFSRRRLTSSFPLSFMCSREQSDVSLPHRHRFSASHP